MVDSGRRSDHWSVSLSLSPVALVSGCALSQVARDNNTTRREPRRMGRTCSHITAAVLRLAGFESVSLAAIAPLAAHSTATLAALDDARRIAPAGAALCFSQLVRAPASQSNASQTLFALYIPAQLGLPMGVRSSREAPLGMMTFVATRLAIARSDNNQAGDNNNNNRDDNRTKTG